MPRRRVTAEASPDELAAMETVTEQTGGDPVPGQRRGRRATSTEPKTGNRGRIPVRTPAGKIASKAQQIETVREQIEFFLSLGAAGWAMRDEECAATATDERIGKFTEGLTRMVARSPKLLNYAATTGILGDIVMMLSAAVPVATAVWKAHGPNGHRHGVRDELEGLDSDRFPAYAPG